MPILPKPFRDEVIGSVFARARRQSGLSVRRLVRSIFGSQRTTYSFLLGENIGAIARLAGVDPREMLEHHTMFPYAVAFMAPETQRRLTIKALTTHTGSLSSLTKNISHGVRYRRLCKACVEADLAQYGEAYWHREHLLPGALMCLRHRKTLFDTSIELRGCVHASDALLPHEVVALKLTCALPNELALRFTAMSVSALQGVLPKRADWLQVHRARAAELGYLLNSGEIAGAAFTFALRSFYGDEFLTAIGCQVADCHQNPWPALIVRADSASNFAATKHVLIQTFAETKIGSLKSASFAYRRPGKKPREYGRLDAETLEKIRADLNRVAIAGERVTMTRLLKDAGAWSAFRHQRQRFPQTSAFLQTFKQSDQAERQLGGRAYWRKRLPSRYRKAESDSGLCPTALDEKH